MSTSPAAPIVSIVIPCYDAAAFVGETIDSVRAQDLVAWELVVVDDGSRDESLSVVRTRSELDDRIVVLDQVNAGVHVARQRGVAHTDPASRYLVFLDADDLIEPTFLSTFSSYLDQHPDVGMVYGARVDIDAAGTVIGRPPIPARHVPARFGIGRIDDAEPLTPLTALVSGHEAIPSASMLRRSVFERTRGWRRDDIVEDKDVAMQMALHAPVHFLPLRLTRYRRHDTNRSSVRFHESMDRLHELWWSDVTLTDADRRRVRQAIAFDRLVSARAALRSARDEWRARRMRAGVRDLLRAGKRLGTAVVLRTQVGRGRHGGDPRRERPRVLVVHLTRPSSSEAKVLASLLRHIGPELDIDLVLNARAEADATSHLHALADLPRITLHRLEVGLPVDPSKPDGRIARVIGRTPHLWRRRRIVRLAAERHADVVYTSQQRFDCAVGETVALRLGVPHVVHLHYNVGPLLRQRVRDRLQSCDAVIAVSSYVADQTIAHGTDPATVTVILNTIDLPDDGPLPEIEVAPVLGQTGRIEDEKGFVDTVAVYGHVVEHRADARLVLVGDGPARPAVERAIEALPDGADASITGWQPDVAPFLDEMAVFVNPSRGEPFGLTVLEAMAAALPVVAYRDGGIAEIVVDGETGFLHALDDVAGMSRSVELLLDEPELRRQLGAAGRRRAREHFDPVDAGAAFTRVLLDLVPGDVSDAAGR